MVRPKAPTNNRRLSFYLHSSRIRARNWISHEDSTNRGRTGPSKPQYPNTTRADACSALDAQIRPTPSATRRSRPQQPIHQRQRRQWHRHRITPPRPIPRNRRRFTSSGIQWDQWSPHKRRRHRAPKQATTHAPTANNNERDEATRSRHPRIHLAHASRNGRRQ